MAEISNKTKLAIPWLSSAHLINDVYTGLLNPIMPLLALKLGFTLAAATLVMSISHICSSLLQPLFGFFADHMRKRFFIFWGLLATSIFIPVAVHSPNVFILTIFVVLGSLGSSFFHPQGTGLVSNFSNKNYSADMAFFISAGSLGYSFGPVIAGVVAQYLGLNFISYLSIMGIVAAFLMFLCVPKINDQCVKLPNDSFFKTFGKILTNKHIMILLILGVMKSIITNSCFILLPFLWHSNGVPTSHIGFYLCSFVFFGAVGSFVSANIEKRLGAKNVFYISLVTMFPLMLSFILLSKFEAYFYYPVFCLMGFVTMLAVPVNIVMAQHIMPEYKSIIAGFVNGFSWGVSAILLSMVGLCAEKFGIKEVLIFISIIPCLFAYFVKYLPDTTKQN